MSALLYNNYLCANSFFLFARLLSCFLMNKDTHKTAWVAYTPSSGHGIDSYVKSAQTIMSFYYICTECHAQALS